MHKSMHSESSTSKDTSDTVLAKTSQEKLWFETPPKSYSNDVDEVTLDGRLFHTREAATGNARSPMVEWYVYCTACSDTELDNQL